MRDWLPKAAVLWVDMKRGLYDWGGRKPPLNSDGTFRVVRRQILKDCGIDGNYSGAGKRIWSSPEFEKLVSDEENRRDLGIAGAIEHFESEVGPMRQLTKDAFKTVKDIFDRTPDAEDPLALSPAQYVKEYREYTRMALEIEGKLESVKQGGIAEVLTTLVNSELITQKHLDTAMDLVAEYRLLQDRKLAGVIDSELVGIGR